MTAATAPCCNAGRRIVVFVLVHLSAHYLPISIRSARLARLWPTMVTRSVDGCSGTRDISVVPRHRRSLARSLSDYPSDEWTTPGGRPGKPVNRFFVVKVFGLHSLIADDAEIDCVDPRGRKKGRGRERERGKKQERQRPGCHVLPCHARCSQTNSSQSSSSSQFEDSPEVWWSIILKRRMMRGHDDLG